MTDTHLTDTRFDSLELDDSVLKGLQETGFTLCTPIQAETLPIALAGKDVAGQAQTGTGKTAAFLVAAFQHLITHPADPHRRLTQPRVLILAPTRELAVQIHRDAETLGRHTGFKLGLVFGGTGYEQQRHRLEAGVDILIGTPGRLIDYFKQRVFDLAAVQVAVLDEADRMFDLGFIKDIRFLLRRMPKPQRRLGMLFSATLSYRVTELAYDHMNNPAAIAIEPDKVTVDKVSQFCYMTANDEKIPLLIGLLRKLDAHRTIVFVNTKRAADYVWGFLEGNGFHSALLSGDVPQKKRLSLLRQFQSGELPVLVATDVAARGLHVPEVSHVINFDLPEDAEDYVHRIGRTARAGASGDAISFVCETYAFSLPDIEAYIGHKIPAAAVTPDQLAQVDPASRVRPERRERAGRPRTRSPRRRAPGERAKVAAAGAGRPPRRGGRRPRNPQGGGGSRTG